jgi:transcriptional regulator with XRE-family HTH domain
VAVSGDGPPVDALPFGDALARLMVERGLSYRRLASMTGLSGGYLNHLVHGNRPVPANDVIVNVASALDVPPETFRDYRMRVVVEQLHARPELVERLYRELGPG